ncbi:uncharacterized protein PRCAT00006208001 [Priceomyces carsonii]|uniref:uncharacterized protein n=1 Tax=Priceomyces carsonii TaxID=28549 RepID=UPI002EDB59BC|nr:unnamed protein product [Priceomyces carsonii]
MYELSQNFIENLHQKYDKALNAGIIQFNGDLAENEIIHRRIHNSTIDFQLTLLKSLMHRPEKGTKEKDPFAKPEPELTIEDTFGNDGEFKILFNKFPVIPYHFMLVTKTFMSQNTPLMPQELFAILKILLKLKTLDSQRKWFSFYNCGDESGASQPHKHIQFMTFPENDFIPFPEMLADASDTHVPKAGMEPLQSPDLPFAHFVAKLPSDLNDMDEEDIGMYFSFLLQRTLTVLRENNAKSISYNFLMTTKYMMLVPRSCGKYKELGINSCGAIGLFLCKNEELFNMIKEDGPEAILEQVGFPNTSGEDATEYHY